jgi:hypothetical protein
MVSSYVASLLLVKHPSTTDTLFILFSFVDTFKIGQMFNSERNETYGVSTADPIKFTLTTKGFLSDGCSHPVTINGGYGNDTFDVLRNICVLDLNGDSDDDSFVVRSFAAPEILPTGELRNTTGNVTVNVCNASEAIGNEGGYTCGNNEIAVEPPSNPNYLVNSLVDIDGGTGTDRLTIVGTEFGDRYVIQDGKIFGGGLTIKFINIDYLDVVTQEGDDEVYVLSTDPSLLLSLYGGLGSDTFVITPGGVGPVVSKNLRGHRGILEHSITSTDPMYTGVKVRGVQCDILDNDGNYGYVSIVDQGGFHLMTEDGDGSFSFFVYPTTPPRDDVVVNIVAPAALDTNRWVLVNGESTTILNFTAISGMAPQEVNVTYNPEVMKLDITEKNLLLKILVDLDGGNTQDARFKRTQQSLLPIDIRLLPSLNNTNGAKSVSVVEKNGGTAVMEGPNGFNSTYDVYLRPCSKELLGDIKVTLNTSVPGQLILNSTVLFWSDFSEDCRATVEVAAFNDELAEGDQYVNIQHFVSATNGTRILLKDKSVLLAANILVQIYDDDLGGVIIRESNGITALMEMNETDNKNVVGRHHYTDEYYVRLTRAPVGSVEIDIASIAVATDTFFNNTGAVPTDEKFTKRIQVYLNESESAKLIFTATNWSTEVLLVVTAIDDEIEEGVDWLNFASQPSNLVRQIFFVCALS